MSDDNNKKKKPTDEDVKKIMDDISRMMKETGLSNSDFMLVKVPDRTFINCLIEAIFFIICNYLLILSLNGFFKFISGILPLTIMALIYSGTLIVFRNILFTFWKKDFIKYMKIIVTLPVILSLSITLACPIYEINDYLLLGISLLLTSVITEVLKKYVFDKVYTNLFIRRANKKKKE